MPVPVFRSPAFSPDSDGSLRINASLVADWLVAFLKDEVSRRRGMHRVVLGLSGGVDSAVVAFLCARAFGPSNVLAVRMPYRLSSEASLTHAQLVIDQLGLDSMTINITPAVDGYLSSIDDAPDPTRVGNVCARVRMTALFDQSARTRSLPIGTGNKTERLFGYFTWHGDDAPPINPLGDLYKSQVWQLARELGVPDVIVNKPASADLMEGQTDEGDFGISYPEADRILFYLVGGMTPDKVIELGFEPEKVRLVAKRVSSTHWKRRTPTVAMLSTTAIGEYYLRPVDY